MHFNKTGWAVRVTPSHFALADDVDGLIESPVATLLWCESLRGRFFCANFLLHQKKILNLFPLATRYIMNRSPRGVFFFA